MVVNNKFNNISYIDLYVLFLICIKLHTLIINFTFNGSLHKISRFRNNY